MRDGVLASLGNYGPEDPNLWTKTYDVPNQTLTVDDETTVPLGYGDSTGKNNIHQLPVETAWTQQDVTTTKQYNFMGNPLSSIVTESYVDYSGTQHSYRTAETDYGYWPASKYYQQRGTKDQAGRFTYTDYYPSTAPVGSRGQTYEVYSGANTRFTNGDSNNDPPDSNWRSDLSVNTADVGTYAAQFVYDSNGRATDVYKLQSKTANPWKFVHTHTTYAGNNSPAWGEASTVVEDYGGIARTTTTNGYTADGKADDVIDAAGHEFVTTYDLDGVVQAVTRTDVNPNVTLVQYTYGSSGLTNGMPVTIQDGLSVVTQSLTYDPGGSGDGGIGQVASVTETNGTDQYSSSYTYDVMGNRASAVYQTPATGGGWAYNEWAYSDYNRVGTPDNPKWAFETLTQLGTTGNPSPEAMHYLFDSGGRLQSAAFAQTPTATGIISANGSWYDYASGGNFYPAASRALALYSYDPAGRILELDHEWQNWSSGAGNYTSTYLVGNSCAYEVNTGANRGLKTSDTFLNNNSQHNWTQNYGYDANLDYLTSAAYNDGQANATQSWTYDAAGNRASDYTGSSWAYDNLNRMTANGAGTAFSNDVLGNRTGIGSGFGAGSYTWDCLNRMVGTHASSGSLATVSYSYRADGMRVEKILHSGMYQVGGGEIDDQYSRFRYDGQMPMQTSIIKADGSTLVINNGLGARGLDWTSVTTSSGTTTSFPLYDAHGDEVATLSRGTSAPYSIANQRSYGAWGEIRQGATTGGPRGRYCGNLGHVQDDESGLIYMRARYYEATSGRFLSQDPARNGWNWFAYAANAPTDNADETGKDTVSEAFLIACVFTFFAAVGAFSAEFYGGNGKVSKFCLYLTAESMLILLLGSAAKGMIFANDAPAANLKSLLKDVAIDGLVGGGAFGVIIGAAFGKEAGDLAAEMFYIDYCT